MKIDKKKIVCFSQKEKEVPLTSVHSHNADADIWVHEYLTPSWVCLPNDQPVLIAIHPEDTAKDALAFICKVIHSPCGLK